MSKSLSQTIVINNKPGAAAPISPQVTQPVFKDHGHVMLSADFATLAVKIVVVFERLTTQ